MHEVGDGRPRVLDGDALDAVRGVPSPSLLHPTTQQGTPVPARVSIFTWRTGYAVPFS